MYKTLLITQDFPPLIGGIANYYFNRVNKIPPDKVVVLMNRLEIRNQKLEIRDKKSNFKIYRKNFFTKLIWPHWLPLIWHIYWLTKKEKIEMLWVGQVLPVGTAVWIFSSIMSFPRKRESRMQYFITCHGNDLLRAKSITKKFKLAKKILQEAEHIEANTEFTKNILVKDFGLPENKIKIIYPECTLSQEMVDQNKVEELKEKYHLAGKKVLLTVARLVESKGIDNVIKALPLVWQEIPDLVYLVVGDGPDKNRLKKICRDALICPLDKFRYRVSNDPDKKQDAIQSKLAPPSPPFVRGGNKNSPPYEEPVPHLMREGGLEGVTERVIFTGAVPHNELPNYYALAHAFILTPCHIPLLTKEGKGEVNTDTESFGLVYLEALAFGLPVIAGDVGGVREIISTRRDEALPCLYKDNNFILVNSENIEEIAGEIKKILGRDILAQEV